MRKLSTAILALMMASQVQAQLKTPAPSPLQTINQAFAITDVNLEYSRPSAKGRNVFGDLVPYGEIWRTGANGSTKITFKEEVSMGGKSIKAGTYAIYTKPNADQWEVMLYSDVNMGGNVAKYDASLEVAKWSVKAEKLNDFVETFTIQFANISDTKMDLQIMWANTRVTVPIVAEIDSRIMNSIQKQVVEDNRPYFQAANYYYQNNKDMGKALEWVNKAIAGNPSAFWMQALKAKIQLKQNDKKGAAATAKMVVDLATKANNADYVKIGQDLLKQAK